MNKSFKIAATALLLSLSTLVSGQVVNSLVRETDPAAMGLAGASVAMQANAYALYNNPAAMSLASGRFAAAAAYGILQPSSVKMGAISAASYLKLGEKWALGVGFQRLGYDPYDITSEEGRSTSQFTPSEMELSLAASWQFVKGLSAGVKFNYASIGLSPDYSKAVICADLGLSYTRGTLTAGLNARNLGSQMMDFRAGAAYGIAGATVYVQGEYLQGAGVMAAIGAQYALKEMVFFRAGYHLGSAETAIPSYLSLGLGLHFSGVRLDVSYLTASKTLGNTLAFGLGYVF